jgi:hypothetical protein
MSEEEESFEFVDKRRTTVDARVQADGPDDGAETRTDDNAGTDDGAGETHPRLAARDRLFMCTDILHQGAWIALGLVKDPVTDKIEKDLNEARVLIDSVADLVARIEPLVEEPIRRELKSMVATLRMNFVNQAGR